MTRSKALLPILLLFGAASQSQADARNYGVQCLPGSLQACASVVVWNNVDPATGQLYLYVQISNLQGTPGFEGTGPSALTFWSLDQLTLHNYTEMFGGGPGELDNRSTFFSGFGDLDGNTFYCFLGACTPNEDFGVGEFINATFQGEFVHIQDHLISDTGNVLWGCTPPPPGEFGPATCGGTVTWRVHLGFGGGLLLDKDQSNLTLSFWGYDTNGNFVPNEFCTVGIDCVSVVPEPFTIVLLGSGLAAMGGFGALRRRRRPDEAGTVPQS